MDDRDRNSLTKAWEYYEAGRAYNNSLVPNQYDLVNTNVEFFAGNQWLHLPQTKAMQALPKPVFNIIKRAASMFVASLTSSGSTISFEPLSYYDGEHVADPDSDASEYATAEVQNLLEKFQMDYRIREALFDGAQTGDYCAHFWYDPEALPYGGAFGAYRGEIKMELVDGINVMFGNPNVSDPELQPYILVIGRETVDTLRAEARLRRKDGGDEAAIMPDSDWIGQMGVGGRTELIVSDDATGKALYAYLYTKKTHSEPVIDPETGEQKRETVLDESGDPVQETDSKGLKVLDASGAPVYKTRPMTRNVSSVHVTKATKNCVIFEDVDTGLTHYPVAWSNWEKQKNQYHGRALATEIIPNQIYINTMFALVMRHLQLCGFPKTVYNADMIAQWSNEVGQAIGVYGMQPGDDVGRMVKNLSPADMSNQILLTIDKAMQYTRDCIGATDVQMGKVNPENTSALMVLQSASEVPLENIRSGLYEWLEQIGRILLDMMGTYYGKRPIVRTRSMKEPVTDPATGAPRLDPMSGTILTEQVDRKVIEEYDFTQFKHLWLNTRVDVGATTYFSEIAMVQTLDNLRRDGTLDVIDYLERIPDKLIPKKDELIKSIRERMTQQSEAEAAAQMASVPASPSDGSPAMGGELSTDKVVAGLPGRVQSQFSTLPRSAQNALIKRQSMK